MELIIFNSKNYQHMKTVDTKSLLLGVLGSLLFISLSSSKNSEHENDMDFIGSPNSVGIYNKTTKTIYLYKVNSVGIGMQESPSAVYKVGDDGSRLIKK